MLKKTLMILLPILLLFCFAGSATADGADGEVESYDYGSDTASADSGAVSLEGSETSSADTAVSSEPVVTEMPVENVTAEITGTAESGSPADKQGNDSENIPAADSEPLEGGALDPERPAEPAEQPGTEEQACAGSDDEAAESSPVFYDPYFYYASGGRSPDYPTIDAALTAFNADGGKGYIYVESGTFTGNVTVNPTTHSGLAALTGIVFKDFYAREADEPFNPYDSARWPIINGNVSISNMPSGFTLLGFRVAGSVLINSCTGQLNLSYLEVGGAGSGIIVYNHTGNVTILNVESNSNLGYGADITNHGNVTITNSSFNNNSTAFFGIRINTSGAVTANGTSASGNLGGRGMEVIGFSRLTIKNADFSNNSQAGLWAASDKNANISINNAYALNNGGTGMALKTEGVVTVIDVIVSKNSGQGIRIENHESSTARNVTLTRVAVAGKTALPWSQDGIYILSKGNVLLTDVSSSNNRNTAGVYSGLYINNMGVGLTWTGTGNVTIRSSKAGTSYDFSGNNRGFGINILSNGVVSVSDVVADDNGQRGIYLQNYNAPAARNVTLTRCSANNNAVSGTFIQSKGTVILTDVSASHNGANITNHGISINNTSGTGNVTIRSSRAADHYRFSGNGGNGIYIGSNGAIAVSNVIADGNGLSGINLQNHNAPAARNVTLTRCRADSNSAYGIYIQSKGAVNLIDVSASHNGTATAHHGVYINNTSGTGNVTIRSSRAADHYRFSVNARSGIDIESNGAIAVSNVIASVNGVSGINLQNHNATAAKNVTLTRCRADSNSAYGIYIQSKGAVNLTDFRSSGNGTATWHHGVYINNTGGTGNVMIRSSKRNELYGNTGSGILISSNGAVSVSNVIAHDNGQSGINLQNHNAPAARNVTLTLCLIGGSTQSGIYIQSKGTVILTAVSALGNGTTTDHHGVYVTNTAGTANVTIRSSKATDYYHFSGNYSYGIMIFSNGAISVSNVIADGNGLRGIFLRNDSAPAARNVTLTRCSADSNDETGIHIISKGAVTLTDVRASGNGTTTTHHGVYVANTAGTANVTIRSSKAIDYYHFSGNYSYGITIFSNGAISVSNVIADGNYWSGIFINNATAPVARNVILTRCRADSNTQSGIYIQSKGAVNLTDISASHNGTNTSHHGAIINNTYGTANVAIRSSRAADHYRFSSNIGNGIEIWSTGAISVSNIIADGNGERGAYLINNSAPAARNVTLTRCRADSNTLQGIFVSSIGTVALTDVSASDNGTGATHHGVVINNTGGTANVTIRSSKATNYYDFSENAGSGIHILSRGTISVSNVNAFGNSVHGVYSYTSTANKNITLRNINSFSNAQLGIFAGLADGTTTVQNVRSYQNGSDGIYVDAGSGKVNFVNSSFIGNTLNGIRVRRLPAMVSLRTTYAAGNGAQNINISP